MHRRKLLSAIRAYADTHTNEAEVSERFVEFIETHERCFDNDLWAGHITGSAWVVDTSGAHTLLTHHKKLDKWLQLGGHSDGDSDTWRVARREAEEESGLQVVELDTHIFDLDVHAIPARKGDPEHFHYDVRFALQAKTMDFEVTEESHALAWVPVDQVDRYTDEWSVLRMAEKWQARR